MSCLTSLTRRRTFGGADSTDLVCVCHRKTAIGGKKTEFSLFIGVRCVKLMGNIVYELFSFVLCRRFGGPYFVGYRFYDNFVLSEAFLSSSDVSHRVSEPNGAQCTLSHVQRKRWIPKWYIRKQTHFYGPIIMPLHCIISCGKASIARSPAKYVPGAAIKSACESYTHTNTHKKCASQRRNGKWSCTLSFCWLDESDGSIEWRSFCVFSRDIWPMLAGWNTIFLCYGCKTEVTQWRLKTDTTAYVHIRGVRAHTYTAHEVYR